MKIFSSLFHSRDKPQNSTAGNAYRFYMGGSTSGKNVTERSAMQMTAVYSCVRVLSEAVAGLPLHVYKYRSDGGKEKAFTHPLYRLLHDEPNPEMTSFVFRETLMTHLLLWGNAYAQIIRNGKGEVVALYPLMPNRMTVDRDSSGTLYYKYYRGSDEAIRSKEYEVVLSPSDVLHIPGLGFDGLVGYSPIAMAKNAIGLAIATEEFGAKFFANGAAPSGVLEHPGTIKDPTKIDRLFGYEVYTSPYVPTIAAGKPVIAFGDFSYYNIGDRGARSFSELKELYAGNGMVGFVAKERADGKLILPEAVQILKMKAGSGSSGG